MSSVKIRKLTKYTKKIKTSENIVIWSQQRPREYFTVAIYSIYPARCLHIALIRLEKFAEKKNNYKLNEKLILTETVKRFIGRIRS